MLIFVILYNLAMGIVDAMALACLHRKRTLQAWFSVLFWAGGAAIVLAGILGPGGFGVVLLAAFGLFLHAPLLLAGSLVLFWKQHRKTAIVFAMAGLTLLGIAADAFLIEPHWLDVSYHKFTSPKIGQPVRVVVVADLQTDRITDYESRALKRAMQEEPDILLFAGDYIQARGLRAEQLQKELNAVLRDAKIAASAGAYAVAGNVDPPGWPRIFDGLPVTVAETTESFTSGGVRVTCLSMPDSRNRFLRCPDDADRFHIVLGHCPSFALAGLDADLLLAGHTHGGQVQLPMIGPLMSLSDIPRSWASGATELPTGGTLIVSRGIGMERGSAPRLRFRCRPEILVIDLLPSPIGDRE